MKGRGLVVLLALLLATLATAGVFMYTRGVEEDAKTGGTQVPVLVSKVDIPARTDLDSLIKDEQFRTLQVPQDAVVGGAVTSIEQLRGKSNSQPILAGEQIPVARISGEVPGGALAIPEGMQALTVALDAPRGVAGAINAGDHVVIYSTFKDAPGKGAERESVTTVLVPTAELLSVIRPFATSTIGGDEATTAEQTPSSLTVTVALSPEDAQNFVFTMENGSVWFGLLPPDANGLPMKPVTFAQVVK